MTEKTCLVTGRVALCALACVTLAFLWDGRPAAVRAQVVTATFPDATPPTDTGGISFGTLTTALTIRLNLDQKPAVTCEGWSYAGNTAIGCTPHEQKFEIVYDGKAYDFDLHSLRLALSKTLEIMKLKGAKK